MVCAQTSVKENGHASPAGDDTPTVSAWVSEEAEGSLMRLAEKMGRARIEVSCVGYLADCTRLRGVSLCPATMLCTGRLNRFWFDCAGYCMAGGSCQEEEEVVVSGHSECENRGWPAALGRAAAAAAQRHAARQTCHCRPQWSCRQDHRRRCEYALMPLLQPPREWMM